MIGLEGQPEQPQISRAPEAGQPAAPPPVTTDVTATAPDISALVPDHVGLKHHAHPHKELKHELRFHDAPPADSPRGAAPTGPKAAVLAATLPPEIVAALEAADTAVLKALCEVLDASYRRHQEEMARQRREAPKEAAEAKAQAQALMQRMLATATITETAIAAAASKLLASRQGSP